MVYDPKGVEFEGMDGVEPKVWRDVSEGGNSTQR
jgi:hypothetical protein